MSVYQYYEFQTVDRPLDEADRAELRKVSSRADITATKFTNVYNWGDFRGDPRKLMARWFDLHLYVASWGTRRLMIRLPWRLADPPRIEEFVREVDEVEFLKSGENLIVDINFDSEESGYDYSDEQGEGWLDLLAPLRHDLMGGDLRLFYVLWLTAVERGYLLDGALEPLEGIGPLSDSLTSMADFFGVNRDLLQAAAESSQVSNDGISFADASRKEIASIPEEEKAALLLRVVNGDPHVGAELKSKIRVSLAAAHRDRHGRCRTVAEIRKRGIAVREERTAEEARQREAERRRRAQEAAQAQQIRIEAAKRRGARIWDDVEKQIGYVSAPGYDRAVRLLVDLQALAHQSGTVAAFAQRIRSIRERHRTKKAFIRRLDKHRIGPS